MNYTRELIAEHVKSARFARSRARFWFKLGDVPHYWLWSMRSREEMHEARAIKGVANKN